MMQRFSRDRRGCIQVCQGLCDVDDECIDGRRLGVEGRGDITMMNAVAGLPGHTQPRILIPSFSVTASHRQSYACIKRQDERPAICQKSPTVGRARLLSSRGRDGARRALDAIKTPRVHLGSIVLACPRTSSVSGRTWPARLQRGRVSVLCGPNALCSTARQP